MVEKIDHVALRESIRKQYADWPTNGDKVLEFEGRAAEVIADLSVFIVKEVVELKTPLDTVFQGLAAIFSVPLENLISNEGLQRQGALGFVVQSLAAYILSNDHTTPDSVEVPRNEVGDA